METDKERKIIYSLLLEEKLEAFFLSFRTQLHVYKVEDLMHVTRKDLSSIGLLSGPDVRRFEKVIGKVTKNTGLKGIFTKVLPKKQKQLSEIPAAVTLWEEFDPVIIKSEDLILKEILGEGNFGKVYQGEWIRRLGGHEVAIDVAVKCLIEKSNDSFMKEVSILSQLDQKHDNIIKLYGISIHEDTMQMVTEYAEQGPLLEKLRNGQIRSVSLLCQFAVQIASGMLYLEQKGLVHRDLAARNILVTAHNQVKISDFGLAKLVGKDKQWVMTAMEVLPLRWMPLESLLQGRFTSASDVWSFGVVLWEMFSFGEHPWESITSKEVIEKLKDGERLPEPQYCPSNVYAVVMKRCWTENPNERLNFDEARNNLICIHPTSSFAASSQQREHMLSYSVGDTIIAVKSVEGQSNIWLGQNERTLEFGHYVKSDTQPVQTKIPFTLSDSLSPDKEKPLGRLPVGERSKAIAASGNVIISKPIAIPEHNGGAHAITPPTDSAPRPSSLPSRQIDADLSDTEQGGRNNSTGAHDERKSLISDPLSPNRNGIPIPSPMDPFYSSINETREQSKQDKFREKEPTRRASLPIPDRLAFRTTKRYPSLYVSMKDHSDANLARDEEPPDLMSRDHEKSDSPWKSGGFAPDFVGGSHRNDVDSHTGSDDGGGDVGACSLDSKKDVVRLRPKKPPRVSKCFYFDDSALQAEEHASQQIKSEVAKNPYENTGVFELDPSAWLHMDSVSGKEGSVPNGGYLLPAHEATTNVVHLGPKMRLHIPTKKQNSWKRMKQLRKTQSLESLSLEMALHNSASLNVPPFHDSWKQREIPEEEKFDDKLSFSADTVSYKKLEKTADDEVSKRRSLFGIKLRKKSRKDRYSGGPPANLGEIVSEVEQALPDSTQPEIATALEVSKWSASDAIKYLKVSKLVKLGLCPDATCVDMLKTYDWNVLEASYAIKIHYVMAIHLDMSLEEAAKLLRESDWNLDIVLNKLKVPAFISESEDIGYDSKEAEGFLEAAGFDIDKALRNMKVKRVADITQKHEEYCRTTLEHCQWRVDRAVTFIVESL